VSDGRGGITRSCRLPLLRHKLAQATQFMISSGFVPSDPRAVTAVSMPTTIMAGGQGPNSLPIMGVSPLRRPDQARRHTTTPSPADSTEYDGS
jgi:hypothetical protein